MVTEPSTTSIWQNGVPNVIKWTKGLLDNIHAVDIELARLSRDGLIFIAKDGLSVRPFPFNQLTQPPPFHQSQQPLDMPSTSSSKMCLQPTTTLSSSSTPRTASCTPPPPASPSSPPLHPSPQTHPTPPPTQPQPPSPSQAARTQQRRSQPPSPPPPMASAQHSGTTHHRGTYYSVSSPLSPHPYSAQHGRFGSPPPSCSSLPACMPPCHAVPRHAMLRSRGYIYASH